MNRIIRFFNQNRTRIIITILIIAFIFILIYAINKILEQTKVRESQIINYIEDSSIPGESVITGEEIDEEVTVKNTNKIQEFVDYCNSGNYQNAYNLLSEDCKNEVFGTLEEFISNYANQIFNTNKIYSLELWYNTYNAYTYRIVYQENDMLATGNINSENTIEDYITIINENNEQRLNINGFIGKENINVTNNTNNISITINNKSMFRSFEKYNVTVANNTDKTILLSDGISGNDICLIDSNKEEYDSIISELPIPFLKIDAGATRTLDIRFYKMYNPYRTINYIQFKNIITDLEDYELSENDELKLNMKIEI